MLLSLHARTCGVRTAVQGALARFWGIAARLWGMRRHDVAFNGGCRHELPVPKLGGCTNCTRMTGG
jgi:hypothetical protein